MKTSRRPCYCQLEIGSCFCEWDDEDFSKMVKEDLVAFNTALANQLISDMEMEAAKIMLCGEDPKIRGIENRAKLISSMSKMGFDLIIDEDNGVRLWSKKHNVNINKNA